MGFLQFVIKDLLRQKVRLALAVSGIAVALSTCVIMLGVGEGVRETFERSYKQSNVDIVAFEKEEYNIFSSLVDAGLVDKIKHLEEVKDAAGALFELYLCGKSFVPLLGWPSGSIFFRDIVLIEGEPPQASRNQVMIGDSLARVTRLKIHDTLRIKGRIFEITGIFKGLSSLERSAMVIPLDTFQRLDKKKQGKVVGINILLKAPFRNERGTALVIEKMERKFPELTAQDVDVFIAEKWSYILLGDKLSTLIVTVTIIAMVFALSNIMLTSFFERRKLIGLLIAMGWQKSDVLRNLVCQSLLISLAGGVLGIPLGFFGIEHLFGMVEISLFMPVWNMALLAKIIGIIIASGIVAALIPSSIILNLNPVEVIKSE